MVSGTVVYFVEEHVYGKLLRVGHNPMEIIVRVKLLACNNFHLSFDVDSVTTLEVFDLDVCEGFQI